MFRSRSRWKIAGAIAAVASAIATPAFAQIDNLKTLVSNTLAAGGTSNSFATYGYVESVDGQGNPVHTFYTATFGAGAAIRKVVEGSTTSTTVLTEGDLALFYRNGDNTRTVTTPTISGMITNPAAVGSFNSNGALWITDISATRLPGGSTTIDPAATKRFYRYNLGTVPAGGDGRDVLTSLATLADFQVAAGTTNTTNNFGRQAAFSPTGQTVYAVDTSAAFGGVYKIDPVTGATARILDVSGTATGVARLANEPAVLRVGNADRVFISGNQLGTTAPNFNVGGLNYVDYDGATTSPQQTFIGAADLASFLQVTAATEVRAVAAGPDGTVYFYEGAASSRIIARDPQGRMYKVATRTERDQFFTGSTTAAPAPTNSLLRMQTRTVTHPTAGPITQLMYAESTPLNFVAGVDVFKPTDFDRDGDQDVADMGLFAPVLTPRNVATSLDNARYDLNGNGVVDYADVKIAQSFQLFPDGDANFDGTVNFDDLLTVAQNYDVSTGRTWRTGDFNGNDGVAFDDLLTLAQNYAGTPGVVSAADATPQFAADWALAQSLVPEPTTLTALVGFGVATTMRRRRREAMA